MRVEELLNIIKERRSVRDFSRDSVSDREIQVLLEAARFAPSNSNRQAWKFLIIKNNNVKKNIADVVNKKIAEIKEVLSEPELIESFDNYSKYLTFFQDAPVVIIALSKQSPSFLERLSKKMNLEFADRKINSELMSVSMAIQNIQLTAHALGLGTCCMTGPLIAADEIKSLLDVQPPFELAAIVPVGRYEQLPSVPPRKDVSLISEIIE